MSSLYDLTALQHELVTEAWNKKLKKLNKKVIELDGTGVRQKTYIDVQFQIMQDEGFPIELAGGWYNSQMRITKNSICCLPDYMFLYPTTIGYNFTKLLYTLIDNDYLSEETIENKVPKALEEIKNQPNIWKELLSKYNDKKKNQANA